MARGGICSRLHRGWLRGVEGSKTPLLVGPRALVGEHHPQPHTEQALRHIHAYMRHFYNPNVLRRIVHETLQILGRIQSTEHNKSLVILVHIILKHVDVETDLQDNS
jgi:hypothetical protein